MRHTSSSKSARPHPDPLLDCPSPADWHHGHWPARSSFPVPVWVEGDQEEVGELRCTKNKGYEASLEEGMGPGTKTGWGSHCLNHRQALDCHYKAAISSQCLAKHVLESPREVQQGEGKGRDQ